MDYLASITMSTPKKGRPKKVGKPDYVTVKIDVKTYADAKTLANIQGRTTAELVSEIVGAYVRPTLNAIFKKRIAEDEKKGN